MLRYLCKGYSMRYNSTKLLRRWFLIFATTSCQSSLGEWIVLMSYAKADAKNLTIHCATRLFTALPKRWKRTWEVELGRELVLAIACAGSRRSTGLRILYSSSVCDTSRQRWPLWDRAWVSRAACRESKAESQLKMPRRWYQSWSALNNAHDERDLRASSTESTVVSGSLTASEECVSVHKTKARQLTLS